MTQFITLAGRKQVGKDTSAAMIKVLLGVERTHIVHFADALKQACSAVFGIPLEDMETDTGKRKLTEVRWPKDHSFTPSWEGQDGRDRFTVSAYHPGNGNGEFMTVREILQFVGTNLFRNQLDPDIWVQSVYRKKYRDDDIVVVADCRFPNEAEFAKERGLLIGVERDTGLECDGHASETALDGYEGYSYTVTNNGSFTELREKLGVILNANSLLA